MGSLLGGISRGDVGDANTPQCGRGDEDVFGVGFIKWCHGHRCLLPASSPALGPAFGLRHHHTLRLALGEGSLLGRNRVPFLRSPGRFLGFVRAPGVIAKVCGRCPLALALANSGGRALADGNLGPWRVLTCDGLGGRQRDRRG